MKILTILYAFHGFLAFTICKSHGPRQPDSCIARKGEVAQGELVVTETTSCDRLTSIYSAKRSVIVPIGDQKGPSTAVSRLVK